MKPFEIKDGSDELRDANGNIIEVPMIPNDDFLEKLNIQLINESTIERVSLITNIPEEINEEDEGWKFSDVPNEITKITIEKVMIDLVGESWFNDDKEEGYSIGEIIDMLSQKAFVQLSELTMVNIETCLNNGGKVIAYFPDLVWREYFNQIDTLPNEVLGMRIVEIEKVVDNLEIIINDVSSVDGKMKSLDITTFEWLSKDGWMLEVYK